MKNILFIAVMSLLLMHCSTFFPVQSFNPIEIHTTKGQELIDLKQYDDSLFEFVLKANNMNKPKVRPVDKKELQSLVDQANYCKVALYNNNPGGFLLCLPENIPYDS